MTDSPKSYSVLARKYRPQNFNDLIGQAPMVQTLRNAFETGHLAQAWLLTGTRGVGKTTTARILAQALNYKTDTIDKPYMDLDQLGEHCEAIIKGQHPDVVEMDAASHTGIDDVREIIKQIWYKPVIARYKVYIIDEVHMLSLQAFNGLLKTLEEPPAHVKFIFATTEFQKLPITIVSRCQRFALRRVDNDTLVKHLQKIIKAEDYEAEAQALAFIARAAGGSVRDGLSLLDQALSYSNGRLSTKDVQTLLGVADYGQNFNLFEKIIRGECGTALEKLEALYMQGADPNAVITSLAEITHNVTKIHFSPKTIETLLIPEEEKARMQHWAATLSPSVLSRLWQMLLQGSQEVKIADAPLQAAEMLLVRLCYASGLPPIETLLKTLQNTSLDSADAPPRRAALGSIAVAPKGLQNIEMAGSSPNIEMAGFRPREEVQEELAAPWEDTSCFLQEKPSLKQDNDIVFKEKSAKPATQAQQESASYVSITSAEELANLARTKKEMWLAAEIESFFRPVTFAKGKIIFQSSPNASPHLKKKISQFLYEQTGENWVVETQNHGGEATLQERQEEKDKKLLEQAKTHPVTQKLLQQFPGALITMQEKE